MWTSFKIFPVSEGVRHLCLPKSVTRDRNAVEMDEHRILECRQIHTPSLEDRLINVVIISLAPFTWFPHHQALTWRRQNLRIQNQDLPYSFNLQIIQSLPPNMHKSDQILRKHNL